MKVLGIIFSSRKHGNCARCTEYCLSEICKSGYEVKAINTFDYEINGCGNCDYQCFADGACCIEDDIPKIYDKCLKAEKIIFAIPTFSGHLASSYFEFWERAQSIFKNNEVYENSFLRKINLIIIGNLSFGGDMALHEALHCFTNREFHPEVALLSSREYNKSSIKGDLIESQEVKNKLSIFAEKIIRIS
ncbi:flavodoxin family protein [Sedimentibacter sp.]|uniref:flavodoxin family protein n=1 Tax=Sedimentibacter sp. TaxID=1960295 RepID=UPI0028AA2613|nr:flavodoxin family protein [Sedimentibacter sp.]